MINESRNISLVEEFGGFRITRNGPVPIELPNRFVYAVRSFRQAEAREDVSMRERAIGYSKNLWKFFL